MMDQAREITGEMHSGHEEVVDIFLNKYHIDPGFNDNIAIIKACSIDLVFDVAEHETKMQLDSGK